MKANAGLCGVVLAVGIATWAVPPAAAQRQLALETPEEVIRKRAANEEKPLWRVPLGVALVDEMRLLSPNRLLVGLRKDAMGVPNLGYLLIDTSSGNLLWRYRREKKGTFYPLLLLADLLLFRVDEPKRNSLLALHPETGAENWTIAFSGNVRFYPVPGAGVVLVEERKKQHVRLTGINLASGQASWTKELETKAEAEGAVPAPLVGLRDFWHFYGGLEKLSGPDGRSLWSRPDIALAADSPPPQLDGENFYVIHARTQLSALDGASGATRWTVELPAGIEYTNIFPYEGRVYVRGMLTTAAQALGGARHRLLALRAEDGKLLWSYAGAEPSVSNLLAAEGRLYFGTLSSLVVLDVETGGEIFTARVTQSASPYPVRLRLLPDKVVYIGELNVAAFDPATGEKIYSHGMTPVSNEAFLAGLDTSIPRLQQELAALNAPRGAPVPAPAGGSSLTQQQIRNYQNSANYYRAQASLSRSAGQRSKAMEYDSMAYMNSQAASNLAQIDSAFQRIQASVQLLFSVLELRAALQRAAEAAALKTSLERYELFRKSILAVYGLAESGDYLYRPHRRFQGNEDFITVAVVHLPTGRRRDTYLSAAYQGYGLWNLIDFDRGVVYHHGIGLDPAAYEFSEAHSLPGVGKVRTIQNYLIAAPVRIPQ